ncbi:CPBP family intramembrane metalloprotease [Marivirga sp. S37H4]|uniref:CPBP family intramembrane metalloprotease n=1 Tax=Marivirga aurantiaca TaxID=2802615 RepID=A0A935C8T1_9BACT|nr:type II CAAX endopeptidase family protein [Marivirga aurantiaca]MBK6265781.1 CPBP family intramembrane metalloprotease [Marivirga aurantiaca]
MDSFEYKNPQIKDKNPLRSILSLVLLFIAANLIGQLIGSLIAIFVSGIDFYQIEQVLKPPFTEQSKRFLYTAQGISHFLSFTLFGLFFIKVIDHDTIKSYFHQKSLFFSGILLVIFMTISFMFFNSIVIEWNMNVQFPEFLQDFELWARNMEDRLIELTKAMSSYVNIGEMLVAMLVIGILPAIGEELIFRGLLQNKLLAGIKNHHIAIWITAVIFGVFHLQFFGVVPRIFLGALFGYIYYYSGNIWYPIVAHFINNGLAVLVMYLGPRMVEDWNAEEIDSSVPPLMSILSLVICGFLFYQFIKQVKLREV